MSTQFEIAVRLPLARFELGVDIKSSARTLGIFGASGSGKTSLLESIAGWRKPAAGRIRVGDSVLMDRSARVDLPPEHRGIGLVPQDALLFPHWSVRENLLASTRRGAPGADLELLERTVRMLEIGHLLDRDTARLSGGERQRVALARALVSRPASLLLDEPLGAVDLPLRRRILPYLIRVRDAFALPTIFVSHDATEVQALCDEVIVLEEGRVRAQGRPDDVLRNLSHEHALENVLRGSVVQAGAGTARVQLERGGDIHVPASGLAIGDAAVVAIGADDILVALESPRGISARNVLAANVVRLEMSDESSRLEVRLQDGAGETLVVRLTRASTQDLALVSGTRVHLVFKTSSCRVLSALGATHARERAIE